MAVARQRHLETRVSGGAWDEFERLLRQFRTQACERALLLAAERPDRLVSEDLIRHAVTQTCEILLGDLGVQDGGRARVA